MLIEHGVWLWPFDLSIMVLVLNTTCMSSIFVIINLECNSSYLVSSLDQFCFSITLQGITNHTTVFARCLPSRRLLRISDNGTKTVVQAASLYSPFITSCCVISRNHNASVRKSCNNSFVQVFLLNMLLLLAEEDIGLFNSKTVVLRSC